MSTIRSVEGAVWRERRSTLIKQRRKTANFCMKAGQSPHACAHTLESSEDLRVERKIVKKKHRDASDEDLASRERRTWLGREVSREAEHGRQNKDQMLDAKIVSILVDRLTSSSSAKTKIGESLALAILRLLLNLSLDARRGAMIDTRSFRDSSRRSRGQSSAATIRLLYTLSIEDRCKSMVSYGRWHAHRSVSRR